MSHINEYNHIIITNKLQFYNIFTEIAAEMQSITQSPLCASSSSSPPVPTTGIKIKHSSKRKPVDPSVSVDTLDEKDVMNEIKLIEKQLKKEYTSIAKSVDNELVEDEIKQIELEIEQTANTIIRQHNQLHGNDEMTTCAKCVQNIDATHKFTYLQCGICNLYYHSKCVELTALETACIYTFHCKKHDDNGDIVVQIRGDYARVVERYLSNIDDSDVTQLEQYSIGLNRLMNRIKKNTTHATGSITNRKKKR